MSTNNPFSSQRYDLGTASTPSKIDIDATFRTANIPRYPTCTICGQVARYKLISKVDHIPQHTLDKDGYICQYHLEQQMFNKDLFAIKDMDDRGAIPNE